MSHFLDRLTYFSAPRARAFSGDHGVTTGEDRTWEDAYRNRWAHDKIVRSTHGVNCTGSCSWKIYVKGGIVTWETQQTDYPRTRWDMPNHEPRGCARGASYSWYLYSANRVKYPMVRGRLLKSWREARLAQDPVDAWASSSRRRQAARLPERARPGRLRALELGRGQRDHRRGQRLHDQEARPGPGHRLLADPGHVDGQLRRRQPLPEPDRRRLHELLRLVLRPAPSSPQVWGEQTDVPESADWYNSSFIIAWGSNVPQTRTPDAHFFTEVRYKGTKTVAVTPDYSEVAKLSDIWMHPKQGTDAAVAMAMGHVILKEFYFPDNGKRSAPTSTTTCAATPTCRCW
jgi:nitrate reductase alpha subunit